MSNPANKIILVTGANKGIGLEVATQLAAAGHTVLVGARNIEAGKKAATDIGTNAHFIHIDALDPATHTAAADQIEKQFGYLDVLINNAAIAHPDEQMRPSETTAATVNSTFQTNFVGVVGITQALLSLIRKSTEGHILNVSSELGSVSLHADPSWPYYQVRFMAYCTSKAALNMYTVLMAADLKDENIKVNVVNPGYTATDLNHNSGHQTVAEGAVEIVHMAQLGANAPTCSYTEAKNGQTGIPIAW